MEWPGDGNRPNVEQTVTYEETLRRLAIAPVAGLGRVVRAATDVATALGNDHTAALEEPDGD